MADDDPSPPPGVNPRTYKLRMDYEKNIPPKEAGEEAQRKHWHKYMGDMSKADPSVKLYPDQWKTAFPEKYPEYGDQNTANPEKTPPPKSPSYAKGGMVGAPIAGCKHHAHKVIKTGWHH